MNFNIFFILSLFIFVTGCGVKADPVKYPETVIDSYVKSYTGNDQTPEEIERAKRNLEAAEAAKKEKESDKSPSLIPSP